LINLGDRCKRAFKARLYRSPRLINAVESTKLNSSVERYCLHTSTKANEIVDFKMAANELVRGGVVVICDYLMKEFTWRYAQRSGVLSNCLWNGEEKLGTYALQHRAIPISVFYSPTIRNTPWVTDKQKLLNITQDTFQCNSDWKNIIRFYKYRLNTFKEFVREKKTPVL